MSSSRPHPASSLGGGQLAQWYSHQPSTPQSNAFAPASSAFEEALEIFQHRLTADPKKTFRTKDTQATNLHDVLDAVTAAQKYYESGHAASKARRWTTAFAKRVGHYGNIMDVLCQHHPEYVALAWGAMKLLFGAIVEHERLGVTIVTALCEIADALPRVGLAEILYPTPMMKQTIATLYAHIISFLVRALEWYESSKLTRAVQSITKPAALRYDDIVKDIQRSSQTVAALAEASSQAEQRDMHHHIQYLVSLVQELQERLLQSQSLNDSAHLAIRQRLTEVQLTQALSIVASSCSLDHKESLESIFFLRDRRKRTSRAKGPEFWGSRLLQDWNEATSSSSIILESAFRDRLHMRDFCANIIQQPLKSKVATSGY